MRKTLFILFVLGLFFAPLSAQEAKETVSQPAVVDNSYLQDSILKELKSIRMKQDSISIERKKTWGKIKKKNEVGEEDLASDYGAMLKIADNTTEDPILDGWNMFGIATFLIALISMIFGIITFRAQKKTEKHTSNAPIAVQMLKLRDLPRHFYRNLVCTSALIFKYKQEGEEKKRRRYPSESNMRKLETLPDDIVLPIDIESDNKKNAKDSSYNKMHELKLLVRNYNVEVEVASAHLARPTISDESLKQDFDNLFFKPLHLTKATFDYEKALPASKDKKLVERTFLVMMAEHVNKLSEVSNFKLLFEKDARKLLDTILPDVNTKFTEIMDQKDGLNRSIINMLKYGYQKESKSDGVMKFVEKEEGVYLAEINSEFVKSELSHYLQSQEICAFKDKLMAVSSVDDLMSLYKSSLNTKANEAELQSVRILYSHIKPYLDYMRQPQWDFHTMLKLMIAVDAAIELDRIGMVNFE